MERHCDGVIRFDTGAGAGTGVTFSVYLVMGAMLLMEFALAFILPPVLGKLKLFVFQIFYGS
jgi:hypothetical protein